MIKEDYCSYEVAKLLKENGFVTPCDWLYCSNGTFGHRNSLWDKEMFPAPTHQMAMKWLREVHNVFIEISISIDLNGNYHYRYSILDKECKYVRKGYTDFDWTYEKAVEAALKYSLENLI